MFLASNLKKPKENQCFWLRNLKNVRKINVFAPPGGGDPGSVDKKTVKNKNI